MAWIATAAVLYGGSRGVAQTSLTPPPGPGAPPVQPGTTLYVESRLVTLDVVVTDHTGELVSGLTRDDFVITEDKVPQRMRFFEAPEEHHLPPSGTGMLGASGMQNYADSPLSIFVLDELSTPFEDMAYARFELKKYLDRQPARLGQPAQLVAVTNKQLVTLTPWTQNRDALLEALGKRRPDIPYRIHGSGGGDPTAAAERLSDSLAALSQLAQAYAGERGRKSVIWMGHGFPALNLANLDATQADIVTRALHATAALLIEGRLVIYTIDPAGLPVYGGSPSAGGDAPSAPDLAEADDTSFESLTTQTGGRAFKLRNDLDVAVSTSVREGATYYAMSYAPSNHNYDGKYRQITVTVRRPGLVVHTRDGYYADRDQTPSPAMVGFELSKASTSPLPYTGLLISAGDIQGGAVKDGHAAFRLTVDPRGLTWEGIPEGDRVARFLISVTLTSKTGSVLEYKVKNLATTAKAAQAGAIMQAPLQYAIPVDLQAGTNHMRVVVRDATSGRIGSADFDAAALTGLLSPHKSKRS